MPVVFRKFGYRFFFYSNEGDPREPVHVHVRKDGCVAKFWVSPAVLVDSDGFDARCLRQIAQLIEDHAELIERVWHDYFG